jgi:pantetheine-phosphate adenylyltransferase
MEIIRRASGLFDHVVVLVSSNVKKRCLFDAGERIELLRCCAAGLRNVAVEGYEGLVAHYAKEIGASAIVKGLRAMSDFDSEFQQALINRHLNPGTETVFIPADSGSMFLSSSAVKQVCALGGDISALVPAEALGRIAEKVKSHNHFEMN